MRKDYFIIITLGCILFLPFLGGVHLFDWDEINFAECAREMLATSNYLQVQIDFEPFWEKPPLFIWMQAGAMHLFGINEFAARFPNAICGIVTLLFLFFIGKKLHSRTFGWLWVMAYVGSILPHLYFRSGIIDPWFNLFIFSSLCLFVLYFSKKENFGIVKSTIDGLISSQSVKVGIAGALLGLAVLTKGPVAILITALTFFIYWALKKFKLFFSIPQILIYIASAFLVTSLWFGAEIISNGTWFVKTFIDYQIRLFSTPDAGHGGFLGYHFVVLLLGCFPTSIFALPSFWKNTTSTPLQHDFRKWMLILFWVVLILFSIVQSKIVHYSSLCYFPLTYLAVLYLESILQKEKKLDKRIVFGLLGIGILIGMIFIALPFVGKNIELLFPFFKQDAFALENLKAEVVWNYWDVIPGVILLGGLVSFYFLHSGIEPPAPLKGERDLPANLSTDLNSDLSIDETSNYSTSQDLDLKENKFKDHVSGQGRLLLQGDGGLKLAGKSISSLKSRNSKSIVILFLSTTLFITSSLYFFINKIEGYSQNAAIEFYQSLEDKDVYVKNVGFKSYAPLFYFKKSAHQRKENKNLNWLLSDETDKDVYFITRIQDEKRFQNYPSVKEVSRKNGFVFFEKIKK